MDYKEKLKDIINNNKTPFVDIDTFLKYFPELKDIENEKIRKEIINHFKAEQIRIKDPNRYISWIAWLEKQGEKPNNVYDKELSEILGRVIHRYINDPNILYTERKKVSMEIIPYVERLEKQAEKNKQTFWEKCNYCKYFDGYDICLHKKNFGSVTNESKENCENNKFYFEKQGEQKPVEWDEEDEKRLSWVIDYFNPSGELYSNLIYWFKSLKDRIQLQNLTVTDEELIQAKKEAYNDALNKIEYHSGEPSFDDGWSSAIWYLKKRIMQLQSKQEYSEEYED